MRIGPIQLDNQLILAPMAGVTDLPFRLMCKELGAGLVVSEMVTSDKSLWNSKKTRLRLDHTGEPGPISVQIAGTEPQQMAEAAIYNVDKGAQIIDINMGCPAKKVCKKAAGSALLRDEIKVAKILAAVVKAVDVPVTLKIRTGWSEEEKNALEIARIAELEGIQALAVHGRTRACGFKGIAEHETVKEIKRQACIPIIANGDINNAQDASRVLQTTNVDAVMIGRGAQGWPWIFGEIMAHLKHDLSYQSPDLNEQQQVIIKHLHRLYEFYGEFMGLRIARKHLGWYLDRKLGSENYKNKINRAESVSQQLKLVNSFFKNNNKQTREKPGHVSSFSPETESSARRASQ